MTTDEELLAAADADPGAFAALYRRGDDPMAIRAQLRPGLYGVRARGRGREVLLGFPDTGTEDGRIQATAALPSRAPHAQIVLSRERRTARGGSKPRDPVAVARLR